MKVIENENVVMVDVDDTLVMHVKPPYDLESKQVKVQDPLNPLATIEMVVNEPMVRLVREEAHRGTTVVVWSRGGYEWAQNVVVALKLTEVIDYVMSKPTAYFDDKPVEEWLKYRVYLKPETIYKNRTINLKETK